MVVTREHMLGTDVLELMYLKRGHYLSTYTLTLRAYLHDI